MNEANIQSLNDQHNKRINNVDNTHNEATAAWANSEESTQDANVSIPSVDAVMKAKDWVDNGSRL